MARAKTHVSTTNFNMMLPRFPKLDKFARGARYCFVIRIEVTQGGRDPSYTKTT